jgi:hypothetical protein
MNGGMTKPQKKMVTDFDQLLHDIRTDPVLAEAMKQRGYDEESWAYGKGLRDTAVEAARLREQTESTQLDSTNAYETLRAKCGDQSRLLADNAVTLLQGHTGWLNDLGLHRARSDDNGTSRIRRPHKDSPFETEVVWERNLYAVAINTSEIADILARHGFPGGLLIAEAAEVEELVERHQIKEQAKIKKTEAKLARDQAFEVFDPWLRCAIRTADKVRKWDTDTYGLFQ